MTIFCDGLCCPDAPRCARREAVAAEIRAMQAAACSRPLSEDGALSALSAAAPHLGERYNLMRAAVAAAAVLYPGFAGYSHGARLLCLSEAVAMLRAVLVVRRVLAGVSRWMIENNRGVTPDAPAAPLGDRTDPFENAVPGDPDSPETQGEWCGAAFFDHRAAEHLCTRPVHPSHWQHVRADGAHVVATSTYIGSPL